jgi:hypothetical protein
MRDNEAPELDLAEDIMAFENGELTEDQTIDFFQRLIDSGLAWQLQGMYGRTAHDLIRSGRCCVSRHRVAA